MKEIPLTQGKFAMVDDEDFEYLNQWKWCALKCDKAFYAIRDDYKTGKTILMHRIIIDAPDGMEVDHKDGNGLNNQRHNLRLATRSQNAVNQNRRSDNTSGFKGVSFDKSKRKWMASTTLNGVSIFWGRFSTAEAAARVYDDAVTKIHGEFARLNFPKEDTT